MKSMLFLRDMRCVFWALCILSTLKLVDNIKIKIIDEPFSTHHSGIDSNNFAPVEKEIIPKVKPERLSGPPHLFELEGRCFSLHKESYKYEFCPFHNVTQREQTYRWNAFHGALGIWREWEIVGGKFNSMLMMDGESCIAHLSREVKVFFKCGYDERIVDIEEPSTCKYNLTFETPLACPVDAFLVYPLLSKNGKMQWESIDRRFSDDELTLKGYEKKRRELFIEEHLKIGDAKELESSKKSNNEQPLQQNSAEKNSLNDYRLFGRTECIQKYGELLSEVQHLRLMLKVLQENKTKTTKDENKDKMNKSNDSHENKNNNATKELSFDWLEASKNPSEDSSRKRDEQKATLVSSEGPRYPKNVRKGQKGDDGANIKAKLHENSVIKSMESLMKNMGTARKRVNLTEDEQKKRDREIMEEHKKTHRVH